MVFFLKHSTGHELISLVETINRYVHIDSAITGRLHWVCWKSAAHFSNYKNLYLSFSKSSESFNHIIWGYQCIHCFLKHSTGHELISLVETINRYVHIDSAITGRLHWVCWKSAAHFSNYKNLYLSFSKSSESFNHIIWGYQCIHCFVLSVYHLLWIKIFLACYKVCQNM